LFALGFLSIAAPVISAFIHSACVFHSGIRFYNAELWRLSEHPSLLDIITWIGGFSVLAIVTFLALLPFRRRALYCWIVWAFFIVLWTWFLFKMEIAYH
jgi:hypothetical protein